MFNKIILVGNLTRDVDKKLTRSGLTILNNAIAATRKYKAQNGSQKEETLFIDLTFFGRTAEVVQKYLHKGSKVLIEGRLKLDQWTDQNGQKKSKHSINVETMQIMDSKGSNQSTSTNKTSKRIDNISLDNRDNPFSDEIENGDLPF